MGFKIKSKRYLEVCRKTLARATKYRNEFPWNCGYFDGTFLYGDCWNFNPKSIIWGEAAGTPVCDNYTPGTCVDIVTGVKKSGLPDTTGDDIINRFCTQVSFAKMLKDKKAPCLLLITGRHMGAYIGQWTKNGKTYNVCQYTSHGSLGNGLCSSYVDENGARRVCKDGKIIGYWNKAGYLTSFIDYSDADGSVQPTPTPAPEKAISEKDIRKDFGKRMEVIAKGSKGETVKVLQKILKDMGYYTDDIDGKAGGHTVKAIKAIQTDWHKKDSSILIDGSFGPQCWTKMMEG